MVTQEEHIQVLLIEDNEDHRCLLETQLQQSSVPRFQVTPVEDLAQGLAHISSHEPDVILLDLGLPDTDGLEGLNRIRAAQPDVAVIVLTMLADEAVAIQAVQAGAQDYLVKNETDTHLLVRAIRYAIERQRLLTALKQAHEHEMRVLEGMAETAAVATAREPSAVEPIRQRDRKEHEQLVSRYADLLDLSMQERVLKIEHKIPDHLKLMAGVLASLAAGPRDVIDIHTTVLKSKTRDDPPQKVQAVYDESRLMVLQLMGNLVNCYRGMIPADDVTKATASTKPIAEPGRDEE